MGIRFDRELVRDAMQAMLRACDKRNQAIEEGIRACNDFIADANLTGKAWEAAKADIQAHQKHDLELLRERNEEHRRAARQTIDLADSAPYSMIDVDEGNALIARLKAIDSRIAAIPRQVELSVRGEFQATADTMRGAVADYIAWIRRNNAIAEDIDQQGLTIWRPLNQPVNTSDNTGQAVDANAVMAKFRDGKISKKDMIKFFEKQYGMSKEDAEFLADFTDKYRKWAKKHPVFDQNGNVADPGYLYCALLANIAYGDDGISRFMWALSAGTEGKSNTEQFLIDELGYSPKEASKVVGNLKNRQNDGKGTSDFLHEMGSLAAMQNPSNGHLASSLSNFTWSNGPRNQEESTWGGDIASGKAGFDLKDMNADMDAINIQKRIEKAAGPLHLNRVDTIGIAMQYHQEIVSGKTNRADEFCANYGNGDPVKGQKWLQNNAQSVGTNSIGGFVIKEKGLSSSGDPVSGDDQKAAADAFNKQIDNERKHGNDAPLQ